MRYVLFIAGPGFVSVVAYATYRDAEAAYYAAVAKVAFGTCATEAVVLMTQGGRLIYEMS